MTDQAQKLRDLLNNKGNVKEAKSIAILSGKGGVGKSNFALNFSIGLQQKGKKVLLFDLDFGMGNIDVLMGLTPKKTIIQMFEESLKIKDIIEEGPHSISYVAAGSGLTDIFHFNPHYFDYFIKQLETITMHYDYIIFDLGAGMQDQHLRFALAANECFIVTTTEPTSITDAYAVMKHLYSLENFIPIYVLVNRSFQNDGDSTLIKLKAVVERFLKHSFIPLGVLPDDRAVINAVKAQVPFLIHNKKSDISLRLNYIVEGYLGIRNVNHRSTQPHSFVTKLKKMFTRKVD
ncbi:flagellar biosynthesis protein FlhG [Salinibacillus kushneri]|uniref:Flagellar biosynthesis protein FlhG n=1 Tax=Salinibacillus kushneri TaxID=237682 RepID=A0A1I0E7K9_9BACI|nr:MinD/ParA family protein [Salinibacillus kushneri]SET41154.1 flagellar biosynthesis protein FlhG [Salinibacillus kushneri]